MGSFKLKIKKRISNFFLPFLNSRVNKQDNAFRVLSYHSITDDFINGEFQQMTTPKGLFEEQLKYLKENNYAVFCAEDLLELFKGARLLPKKSVCITFDDGFKDNLTNAAPILNKYGFKATIFLTVDLIGKEKKWLDWDEIKQLQRMGIFSFGSHTLTHKKLSVLKLDELRKEIHVSKNILEDHLAFSVTLFAYPFGCYDSFDKSAIEMLKACGYKAAFTTIAGTNSFVCDPYTIKRTRISWCDDKAEFAKELQGAYDWYRIWQVMTSVL